MLKNEEPLDSGNAGIAQKLLPHPEVARREAEIEATELDEEETRYALWIGKSIKWRKSQNETTDFKA